MSCYAHYHYAATSGGDYGIEIDNAPREVSLDTLRDLYASALRY